MSKVDAGDKIDAFCSDVDVNDTDIPVSGLLVPVEGIKTLLAGGSVMLPSPLTENILSKSLHFAFISAFSLESSSSTELCFSKIFWHFTQRKINGLLNNSCQ